MRIPKKAIIALAAVGTLAAGAGAAYAAIPTGDGVIHACYTKNGGALRVSDTGECKANEVALSWNNVGPAGLTWQGEWASGSSYRPRDAVFHQGSSYVAIFPSTGSAPPNANWMPLAAKGEKGEQGPQGVAGPQGEKGQDGVDGRDGAPGPQGPAGSKGDTGAPGPAGASDAFIVRDDAFHAPGNLRNFTQTTVVTLNLPAGAYAVFGKVSVGNNDGSPQDATCGLSTGEKAPSRLGSGSGNSANREVFAVQDLLSLNAPGAVSLWCSTFDGYTTNAKITAIKVGALHG